MLYFLFYFHFTVVKYAVLCNVYFIVYIQSYCMSQMSLLTNNLKINTNTDDSGDDRRHNITVAEHYIASFG